MPDYDGPTLRSVRESVHVPLRRVARLAGMSHGHLSKVERAEKGRPVTPAIIAAYEKATGVRLDDPTHLHPTHQTTGDDQPPWQPGALNDARRQAFNSLIASVAVGGPIGQPRPQLVDAIGHYLIPDQLDTTDADLVAQAAHHATSVDLTHGGGLSGQLTRAMLRWATGLTKATTNDTTRTRLYAAIGQLAHRAGWAAFDAGRHEPARNLFTLALDAAVLAADRDLRAHILADVAAQHHHLGHPHDTLTIIELTEADTHLSPPVRAVLYTVKARAYATLADADMCWRYITRAEQTLAGTPRDIEGWQATIAEPAHLYAATGHATATLTHHTRADTDRHQAIQRLTEALDQLNPHTHTRPYALAAARLATLHLNDPDDPLTPIRHTHQTLTHAHQVRSARLTAAIDTLRATATAHHGEAGTQIVKLIDEHHYQTSGYHRYTHTDHPRTSETLPTTDTPAPPAV